MADQENDTLFKRLHGHGGILRWSRTIGWGLAAAALLVVTAFANWPQIVHRRAAVAMNAVLSETTPLAAAQTLDQGDETKRELRRLQQVVQALSVEHNRLSNRVAVLERNLEDLTGSIALTQPARRPTIDWLMTPESQLDASPLSSTPPSVTSAPAGQAHGQASFSHTPESMPSSASSADTAKAGSASSVPTGPRHGIDLGSATTLEGLRVLWNTLQHGQAAALIAGLKPVVAVHDVAQPGTVELRLVAGPVPSALDASRLCAAIAAAGTPCHATTFDGQNLAAR